MKKISMHQFNRNMIGMSIAMPMVGISAGMASRTPGVPGKMMSLVPIGMSAKLVKKLL